ncbi:MAG: 3'-5' exoribonuclease YhaM family protein [Bacillota bacterium]
MEGEVRNAPYAVREISLARTRSGSPYLRLVLWDGSRRVEGRVWDSALAEQLAAGLRPGDVVLVGEARWVEYGGDRQLNISVLRPANAGEYDPGQFRRQREGLPAAGEVLSVAGGIGRAHLRELLERLFEPGFLECFVAAPAARENHHCYQGGLLQQTLEVVRLCEGMASVFTGLDRDLLLAAALLHDVGKVWEYDAGSVTFERTDPGKLLGHVVMGWEAVRRVWPEVPGFPEVEGLHLEHMLLSHHGLREWGSPVEPSTPEAVALHQADLASARLHQALEAVSGLAAGAWSVRDGTGRYFWAGRVPDQE